MSNFPMGELCYALSQGEKARIANRLATLGKLGKDDKKILKAFEARGSYIGDPGEHISAMGMVLFFLVDYYPDSDLQEAVDDLADKYSDGLPIGYAINRARVAMVTHLRALRDIHPAEIAELIGLMAAVYIFIDLDKDPYGNEGTGKP